MSWLRPCLHSLLLWLQNRRHHVLTPGVLQMMKTKLLKFNPRFGMAKIEARAYIGASLCCEAELTLVMGK